jgi:rubrerythrin
MSFINTHEAGSGSVGYASLPELIRDISSSLNEEIDAKNSYSQKIERLKNSTDPAIVEVRDSLIEMYEEIMGDENNHLGRIFSKILALDPTGMEKIRAGMAGKE